MLHVPFPARFRILLVFQAELKCYMAFGRDRRRVPASRAEQSMPQSCGCHVVQLPETAASGNPEAFHGSVGIQPCRDRNPSFLPSPSRREWIFRARQLHQFRRAVPRDNSPRRRSAFTGCRRDNVPRYTGAGRVDTDRGRPGSVCKGRRLGDRRTGGYFRHGWRRRRRPRIRIRGGPFRPHPEIHRSGLPVGQQDLDIRNAARGLPRGPGARWRRPPSRKEKNRAVQGNSQKTSQRQIVLPVHGPVSGSTRNDSFVIP